MYTHVHPSTLLFAECILRMLMYIPVYPVYPCILLAIAKAFLNHTILEISKNSA